MSRTQKKVSAKTLAGTIQKARVAKGLSVIELALKAGVSVASIYSIERGATEKPGVATLNKLIAALDLRLDVVAKVGGYDLDDLVGFSCDPA